jgi:signal transduction histidine kinase
MDMTAVPAGFEEIRREELARTFKRVLRVRSYLQPLLLLILLYMVVNDRSWYRALGVLGATLAALGITLLERLRLRKRGISQYTQSFGDFLAIVILVPLLLLFTGGTRSPFVIQILPVLVILPVLRGRRPTLIVVCCLLALLWPLALLQGRAPWIIPSVFLDSGGRLNLTYDVISMAVLSVLAVGISAVGIALRSMSDSMLVRSLEARSETLKVHAERLQDLITLSGEIAHELKNPLASIKGLAQLIEVEPRRAPERLKFLQGEVDRMRGILDEFLNFSRPLSPLSQEAVDMGDLCRWVVALHEGVAGARQLVLVAPPDLDFQVCCDPRKTKQMLVNLMQNAVEASQDGGEVRVDLDRRDGVARIRVLDRGSGLSKEVAQRAFQPGVTSKARGSGLGLTIVRTLAEQQGGSVSLANREGGGCVAEVVMPVAGVVDAPSGATYAP